MGDTIDIGPYPIETLDYLKTLDNCEMIMGNHEYYKITKIPDDVGEEEFKHQSWVNGLLKDKHLNWLKLFPKIITKEIYGKKLCFLHNNYDDNGNELINIPYKNIVELEFYFKNINADYIFFGHTHIKHLSYRNKRDYCNPGSAGCTKTNDTQFMILNIEKNEINMEYINIEYNKKQLLNEYESKNVPGKEEIINIFY